MSTLTSSIIPKILPSDDFSPISQSLDVGGGQGALMQADPMMKDLFFNRSPVVKEIPHPIAKWLDLTVLLMTNGR